MKKIYKNYIKEFSNLFKYKLLKNIKKILLNIIYEICLILKDVFLKKINI